MQVKTIQDSRPAQIRRIVGAIMALYMIPAFVVAMIQGIQGTGLPGWLLSQQFDILGFGSTKLAVMLAWVAYCIPLFIAGAIWEKAAPEQMAAFREAYLRERAAGLDSDQRPIKTWTGVFILTGLMLVLTVAISGFLYWRDNRPGAGDVHSLELTQLPESGQFSGSLIETMGMVPRGIGYAYKEGDRHHVYVPLTGLAWMRTDAIGAFLHFEAYGANPAFPTSLAKASGVRVKGRLSFGLPVFASRGIQAKGVSIVPKPAVIDWSDGGESPTNGNDNAVIALGIGLFITIITCTLAALIKSGVIASTARGRRR